jgi:serine/threonine protein kinase
VSANPNRAREIFVAALKLAPDQWPGYLHEACGEDGALRGRVQDLLAAHKEAGSVLQPAVDGLTVTIDEPATDRPGAVIGPYKLLQQIGEGGMGTVFMAEQQEPVRRKVALKIIKPGMDTRQVIARFEAERQALAMMDHQNIARVLDVGTTVSGRPYFVMELVHGVPITQFCDDRKLTPRERLELFVPVCQAIQHAHQKGIIHRDVKPSNVLVTMYDDKPVAKVIDFGVAKAVEQRLTERTMFTQFGALVGTFEYMSPEQAEMNAFGVDTRSDIYSLGVLLYELLTGTTPLEKKRLREAVLTEVVRLIKEEEAPRPSLRLSSSNNLPKIAAARNTEPTRLSGLVRGEIDWIVMKCLEKDRTRRYATANGLARDIQRHLDDEPVEACPPSAGYRLRKFARKHRTALRVAGAFMFLVMLGAIASAWQAIRATVAEGQASHQRDIARQNAVEAFQAREEAAQERDKVAAVNQKLEGTLDDLRHTLYVSDINHAYKLWDEGDVQRLEEILERHRPRGTEKDFRGVEWRYLERLCARFQTGRVARCQLRDIKSGPRFGWQEPGHWMQRRSSGLGQFNRCNALALPGRIRPFGLLHH